MKRLIATTLVLLLFAVAAAQAPALPNEQRFDEPVVIRSAEGLYSMLDALARSVGLTPMLHNVPETTIDYNISEAQPFRVLWASILDLHGLGYILRGDNLVIIAPLSEVERLRQMDAAAIRTEAETIEDSFSEFYVINTNPDSVAEIIRTSLSGVVVEVLPGVSTLRVTGTASQHAIVQDLLGRFDEAQTPVVLELRTYRLNNALAADLAQVLSGARAALGVPGDDEEGGGAGELFSITPHVSTNSLLIAAPSNVQEQIALILPDLDIRQEQVNVQVRIQEIQTRAANRLGINLAAGLGQLSASILEGGLSFIFDPQAAVSAFNIGAVLDTLETQGLSRRVDDSSLTVLNNSPTSIQAGGTILISIPGASENIERTIPYGVQIDVTPRVANDRRITLQISARVEDVLSTLDNPQLLELSTRSVTSTITLDPGQTVLLSGLLQNQYIESVNQVPVLGSLPIIGALFRQTVTEASDTELLIIVTADVID